MEIEIESVTPIAFEIEAARLLPGGTGDYNDLTNKPKLNNVELKDHVSLDDIDVYKKGDVDKALESKVDNDGEGVSGALYQLDFNSEAITDETQAIIQDDETKWVRRKFSAIAAYIKSKLSGTFVSTEAQTLTKQQRVQARDNIKAAAGGQRRVTQDTTRVIDISAYTTSENHFQCPCDGYLRLRGPVTGRANASVDNYTSISCVDGAYNMTFVAEGAWLFVSGNPQVAQFLPIELVQE